MSTTKIEKLKEKKAQIEAQIKKAQARERVQQRKDDARRKIIAGALALNHMEANPEDAFSQKLWRLLDEYVVKEKERSFFDLPPLPPEDNSSQATNQSDRAKGNLKDEFER